MASYTYRLVIFPIFLGSVCSLQNITVCTRRKKISSHQHVVGGGFNLTCSALDKTCDQKCLLGGCVMACKSPKECKQSCIDSACQSIYCSSAVCSQHCARGGCSMQCGAERSCSQSCLNGGCNMPAKRNFASKPELGGGGAGMQDGLPFICELLRAILQWW